MFNNVPFASLQEISQTASRLTTRRLAVVAAGRRTVRAHATAPVLRCALGCIGFHLLHVTLRLRF